ncbi:poly-gamma-glutamate hydrolase family protein [Thermoactinomyces mirandus]|uniref:poly-gamma-glutamate hydrolase family protein n=1 Tax=Thermoactinomyces mirandus TaxID=2756294 RepID=UPI0028AE6662|nr:poly-gamma-glutamate hydrolase family protein [Thermoactinomyces mirandus]
MFDNYEELSAHYQKRKDFVIETRSRPNDVIILAVHSGKIEKGTDELAKAIAKNDHSYYIFEALIYEDSNKDKRNDLHLTSKNFDEPTALKMTAQKNRVVSIHGAKGTEKIVYTGGTNPNPMNNISKKLSAAGFRIETTPEDLNGNHPKNIANKSRNLQGAQMELTTALREELLDNPSQMNKFADAVRSAITISNSYPDGRTYDFGNDSFSNSVWPNSGNPFYLTSDDFIRGVQSPVDPKLNGYIRFNFYDQNGKLLLSRSTQEVGHRWFIHPTGLKTGYYKIEIENVSGHPAWVYGGLVY